MASGSSRKQTETVFAVPADSLSARTGVAVAADILPGKGITRCNITACQCSLIRRGKFKGAWNDSTRAWYCISRARQINAYDFEDYGFIYFKDDEGYPAEPEIPVELRASPTSPEV